MCVKSNRVKQLYVILHMTVPKPQVIGVVKQYPLYRQIFEDTKYRELNVRQMECLGFNPVPQGTFRILELEIPCETLI